MKIEPKLKDFIISKGQDENDCLMYLLACKHGLKYRVKEETFEFLVDSKLIKLDLTNNKIIPITGIYEGELIEIPEFDMSIEVVIKERVDEYRSMFKGIRSGSIGEKQKVIQLLVRFCLENNKTFDDVLIVTKVYMDYTDSGVTSNADNFIYKVDKSGLEVSLLKIACEEQGMSSDSGDRTWKVI